VTLRFEKVTKRVTLMDPFDAFKQKVQTIEYRRDPLLGRWSRVNMDRVKRTKTLETSRADPELLSRVEESRDACYFCPDNLENSTPRFPPDLVEKGRIRVGEAVVFPNLFPFGENHAICVLSSEHSLNPADITAQMWSDAVSACIRFFEAVHRRDPDQRYPTINLNLMPPSGASILHPHLQVLMESRPSTMLEAVLGASERYFAEGGSNFWRDLMEKERDLGERYLGDVPPFGWTCPWAPIGNNEVMGISLDTATCVTDLSDAQIRGLSEGLEQVLSGLQRVRAAQSLNFILFSAGIGGDVREYFRLHARVVSRPNLAKYYVGDRGFMEVLQLETVIHSLPEALATDLRATSPRFFSG